MGASHAPVSLRPRHQEIIRLSFQGMSNLMIGGQVGMTPAAVGCVLRSPIARAEIARLAQAAEEKLVDIPAKVRLANEIQGMGVEAFRLRRTLMNDDQIDVRLRARIAEHTVDRVIFEHEEDGRGGSIRDILRRLDEVRDDIKSGRIVRAPDVIEVARVGQEENVT